MSSQDKIKTFLAGQAIRSRRRIAGSGKVRKQSAPRLQAEQPGGRADESKGGRSGRTQGLSGFAFGAGRLDGVSIITPPPSRNRS